MTEKEITNNIISFQTITLLSFGVK